MTNATPDATPETTPAPERTYRTITLSGRPPVRICEQDWPPVAEARHAEYDSHIECQSNRTTKAGIRVRQHQDGRSIVAAWYDYSTAWQGERDRTYRRGELVPAGADLPAAILRVAASMPEDAECPWSELAQECIADLEPEVLA